MYVKSNLIIPGAFEIGMISNCSFVRPKPETLVSNPITLETDDFLTTRYHREVMHEVNHIFSICNVLCKIEMFAE